MEQAPDKVRIRLIYDHTTVDSRGRMYYRTTPHNHWKRLRDADTAAYQELNGALEHYRAWPTTSRT